MDAWIMNSITLQGGTKFVLNQGADLLPCLLARSLTLPLNSPRSVLSAMHFTLKGPAGMREALKE